MLTLPFSAITAAHSPAEPATEAAPHTHDAPPAVHADHDQTYVPHIDNLPALSGPYVVRPAVVLDDPWVAIPTLRSRLDGEEVPAIYLLNLEVNGVGRTDLARAGVPIFRLSETPVLTNDVIRLIGIPIDDVRGAVHRIQSQTLNRTGASIAAGQFTAAITDTTTIWMALYYDQRMLDNGDETHANSAWYWAADALTNKAGIPIGAAVVQKGNSAHSGGVAPYYDVASDCHMQQIAKYEEGFSASYRGHSVVIFSPDSVSVTGYGTAYGYANDIPISQLKAWGESKDYCSGDPDNIKRTPMYLPQAYVRVDGSTVGYYPTMMDNDKSVAAYTAAHEVAHIFKMYHSQAACWVDAAWGNFHVHKTIEAFTSASDTPNQCYDNWDPFGHFHWYFSDAGESAMQTERSRWTSCYNAGWCTSDATPGPVTATATAGSGSVTLSWSAPPDGGESIDYYLIFRGTSSEFIEQNYYGWTGGGTLTWSDTGVTNGQTYWYYVRAWNGVGWGPRGDRVAATPIAAPANDNIGSATSSSGTTWTPASQSTAGATLQSNEQRPCSMGTSSVWFRWTPTQSGTYRVKTEGSSFDTVVAIYNSATLGTAHMGCNDDNGGGGLWSQMDVNLNAYQNYWIQAAGYSDGRTGTLQLNVAKLGGTGGGEIARHDGALSSSGQYWDTGTLITFSPVAGNAPITVTYKYCYMGNSNGATGYIKTVFDGTVVNNFGFTTPWTGGGTCTYGNTATYATRTFTVNSGVSNSIRFDYQNGDWRVSIADIVVTSS